MIAAPKFVIVHDDDLELVQGDQCAAMLLSVLRYWSRYREWVEVTQDEMRVALKGIFSRNRVIAALKILRENGFIETRANPDNRQTRTLQYKVVNLPAANPVWTDAEPVQNFERSVQDAEYPQTGVSTLDKESDSESWKESSPRVYEADEPTRGDKDDDDCPAHIREEVKRIQHQIGAQRVRDVLERCNGKARSWAYIVQALRNERDQKRPSPRSAAPPPSGRDYISGPYAAFIEH